MKRFLELSLFVLFALPFLFAPIFAIQAKAAVGINNIPNVTITKPTVTTYARYSYVPIQAYGTDSDGTVVSMKLVIKNSAGTVLLSKTFSGSTIRYNYYANSNGGRYIYVTARDNIGDTRTVSKYVCIGSCVGIE